MRYHLGLGIGHVGIHGPLISIPTADGIDLMDVDSDFNSRPPHRTPSSTPVDVDDGNTSDPSSEVDEDSSHESGIDSDEEDPNEVQLVEEGYHSDGRDSLSEYDD